MFFVIPTMVGLTQHMIIMSKFNSSKWIDVLGLITTIIGLIAGVIDEIGKHSEKPVNAENNELQKKKTENKED